VYLGALVPWWLFLQRHIKRQDAIIADFEKKSIAFP
jgi:hypothetical protein